MNTTIGGLRAIAMFEAAKGLLVLMICLALFALFHGGTPVTVALLVRQLPFDPARHFPKIFGMVSAGISSGQLHLLVMIALLYTVMRFVEAYGLWFARSWAEWFALVSCSAFLPIEFYELAMGVTWIKLGFLSANLAIVSYIAYVLKKKRSVRRINEGGAGT
ncbi:MAG: DUF2127 domain-containing protein [Chlorobiaceae bacterium]|nr:DUF2127 domain-containing protein [Chlorobiaceae bacterium]